jgi:hypothetical protein
MRKNGMIDRYDAMVLFILIILGLSFSLFFAIKNIKPKEEPKDQYFICCIEKMTSEFYTVVYMKNGESFYPHFTHERQVHAFMKELERLGELNRNGYEVEE